MGFSLGNFFSLAGFVLIFFPPLYYAGMAFMLAGSIISGIEAKREAQEEMERLKAGLRANTRTTERAVPVLYGRSRVGGNIIFQATGGEGSADHNPPRNKLFTIFGICEGPIEQLEQIYFNDDLVWDYAKGHVPGPYNGRFYHEWRSGLNSQAPYTHVLDYHKVNWVASESWPGWATCMVEMFSGPEYLGIPQVTFVGRWKKCADWTNTASPGIETYYETGPMAMADFISNPRYGMGVPGSLFNADFLTRAHSWCAAPVIPGSFQVTENMPRKFAARDWSVAATIPGTPSYNYDEYSPPPATTWAFDLTDRYGLRPGSVKFESQYYTLTDLPRSAEISEYGQIMNGASPVGSISYTTGDVLLDLLPAVRIDDVDGPYSLNRFAGVWKFYTDYGLRWTTAYRNIARSVTLEIGAEVFTETGYASGVSSLTSAGGGKAKVTHATGEIEAWFGGTDWADPTKQWLVKYRPESTMRNQFNYPIWDTRPAIDHIKQMLRHFAGFIYQDDGKICIGIDRPEYPVIAFDDHNVQAGTVEVTQASLRDIPTRVRIKYLDELNKFQPADTSYDIRSVDPSRDVEAVLNLPGVNDRYIANALARTAAAQAGLRNTVKFGAVPGVVAPEQEGSFRIGEVFTLTTTATGWNQKMFRCTGLQLGQDDTATIVGVEHDHSAYVYDWVGGPMQDHRAETFMGDRTIYPSNVTSALAFEVVRTHADGTRKSAIVVEIYEVNSYGGVDGFGKPQGFELLARNANRSQELTTRYTGPNTVIVVDNPEYGTHDLVLYGLGMNNIRSNKAWVASLSVRGYSEYGWQNYRMVQDVQNIEVTSLGHSAAARYDRETLHVAYTPFSYSYVGSTNYPHVAEYVQGIKRRDLTLAGSPATFYSRRRINLVTTSGRTMRAFWYAEYPNQEWRSAAFHVDSYTITSSEAVLTWPATLFPSGVMSGRAEAVLFTNNASREMYAWYTTQDPAGLIHLCYSAISVNMNVGNPNSVYRLHGWGGYGDAGFGDDGVPAGAWFNNSYGYVMLGGSKSLYLNRYGKVFRFAKDFSAWYMVGSLLWMDYSANTLGRNSSFRACGNEEEDGVAIGVYYQAEVNSHNRWGKYPFMFDPRSANRGEISRVKLHGNYSDVTTYQHYIEPPAVTTDRAAFPSGKYYSPPLLGYSIDIDTYFYYVVQKDFPQAVATWMG